MQNVMELINNLNENNQYIIHQCREVGKRNKIFILVSPNDFILIFKIDNVQYTAVRKEFRDVKAVIVMFSKTIGFDARLIVELRDNTTATSLIKNRFVAVEIASRLLDTPFNPDAPFDNCFMMTEKVPFAEGKVNVPQNFAKVIHGKRIRFVFSLLIMGVILFLIAFGIYSLAS